MMPWEVQDHVDREVEAEDLLDLLGDEGAERGQDVGVVFEGFLVELSLVDLVVEHELGGVVLAKGVVAEEDAVRGVVREHAVRPVEHWGLDEDELALAYVEGVAGLDFDEVPVLVVVAFQGLDAIFRAVDWRVRDFLHQLRQRAAVVDLRVVGDDVIDGVQINFIFQLGDVFLREWHPDGVNQDGFFVADQIGIVG